MFTTDPIYHRPLLPVITIKNTANTTTQYTYSSFTGTATVITTAFPIYCSVSLSQNTQGLFTIQFEDSTEAMEATVTVGSRVIIECGKQSGSITRLISGIVRKKGYSRGANGKILYTISGSSTAIRFNERVIYHVSEAAKLASDGITIDTTDATRTADNLLNTVLANAFASPVETILSRTGLVTNSDVETFIASIAIEFGEIQDAINYIEDQSGGEVVVDTTDLIHLRYEIKNTLFGRGFTLKNSFAGAANDDADDTMYMTGKSWSYEDDFYKSANYSNRIFGILPSEPSPSTREEMGFTVGTVSTSASASLELAQKFRPPHTHFLPGDIFVCGGQSGTGGTLTNWTSRFRICKDNAGVPLNAAGIVANIDFLSQQFTEPLPAVDAQEVFIVANEQIFYNSANVRIDSFDLDTTKDYWFIASNDNIPAGTRLFQWAQRLASTSAFMVNSSGTLSTNSAGGSGWLTSGGNPCFAMPRRRSIIYNMWDPKAIQAVQSGITNGLCVDSMLSDISTQIKTKESMHRHLSGRLYTMAKPRTNYNFPRVLAPNIPPFPGDPIVIDDTVLGFSEPGNQVVLTTCGDMTYQWGNLASGDYEAPTILNIQAVGVHPRYR